MASGVECSGEKCGYRIDFEMSGAEILLTPLQRWYFDWTKGGWFCPRCREEADER